MSTRTPDASRPFRYCAQAFVDGGAIFFEAVDSDKEEGFPTGVEERDRYFMDQLQEGELLAADRKWIGACCCMAAERLPAS